MNFMQLRYFLAVATELNFRRAAARLHISQPPLSFHIKALEEQLGILLFTRTTRKVVLTEAGLHLLEKARQILSLVDDVSEEMRDLAAGRGGTLRIGFTMSTSFNSFFHNSIQGFRDAYPNVKLAFSEMVSGKQIEALVEGHLDVGFLRWPFTRPENLVSTEIYRGRLVLALPQSHSLANRKRVPLKMLKDEPFISYPARLGSDIGIYHQIIRLCQRSHFFPRVVQETLEPSLMLGLVAAGSGVAILPSSLQRVRIPGVVYKAIPERSAITVLHFVQRSGDSNPRVRAFRETVLRLPSVDEDSE